MSFHDDVIEEDKNLFILLKCISGGNFKAGTLAHLQICKYGVIYTAACKIQTRQRPSWGFADLHFYQYHF